MALTNTVPAVTIEDAALQAKLEFIEGLIGFCQTYKRTPQTIDEWVRIGSDTH
jgi:hypothetical protein